jgi:hypothetical protein
MAVDGGSVSPEQSGGGGDKSGAGGSSEATSFDTPSARGGGGSGVSGVASPNTSAAVPLPHVSISSSSRGGVRASLSKSTTDSPAATQGALGHVAKQVTRLETTSVSSSQPNPLAGATKNASNKNHNRSSVSTVEGGSFAVGRRKLNSVDP